MKLRKQTGNKLVMLLLSVFIIVSAVVLHGAPAMASSGKKTVKPGNVPLVDTKIKIDGVPDEAAWENALVMELGYEVEPGENIQPKVKTEVRLVCTSSHLYAAFRAYDPRPEEIRARLTDRDNTWDDDYVGIVLDTFNDSRRAYGFFCNPFGVQSDRVIIALDDVRDQWDAIWGSAGRIDENGYTVEMAIPFSSMRFQRKKADQVWGIDAVRGYPRNLSHLIGLFPRDRSDNCYMCQAQKIVGFSGARPGKNIEFDPTLSGVLTQERADFPEGDFVKKKGEVEPGMTARWSFTPNLALNATVNPDFSQVEADAAQLDINTPFALFYPEKRPFFMEGASLFSTPYMIVHTRSIRDPEWGVKLTGKEGRDAIGFFSVRDTVTNLLFPSSLGTGGTSLDMDNMSTALRYRRDIGKSSTLGLVLTDREGDDYYNRLVGIDGDLRLTKRDRVIFHMVGSNTRYPGEVASAFGQPEDDFWGNATAFIYFHTTQNVTLMALYDAVSANFRSDVGFSYQSDYRAYNVSGTYTWRHNPGHWYTHLSLGGGYFLQEDRAGNPLDKAVQGSFGYHGPLQSMVSINANVGQKSYMGFQMDDNHVTINTSMRPSGKLFLGFNCAFGDQLDYSNIQAGERVMLNPALQYNIGKHLHIGFDHMFETLDVQGGRLYTANLTNLKFVYQFSQRSFLRTIFQYADFEYNPALYTYQVDEQFKHLFSQILFSYKLNPQTVLFLGYSDDYYGYRYMPIKQNNRTFFLKVGYALVM